MGNKGSGVWIPVLCTPMDIAKIISWSGGAFSPRSQSRAHFHSQCSVLLCPMQEMGQQHDTFTWQQHSGLKVFGLDCTSSYSLSQSKIAKNCWGREDRVGLDILTLQQPQHFSWALILIFKGFFSEPSIVKNRPVHRSKDYSSLFVLTFCSQWQKSWGDCFKGNPWALIFGLQIAQAVAEQATSSDV